MALKGLFQKLDLIESFQCIQLTVRSRLLRVRRDKYDHMHTRRLPMIGDPRQLPGDLENVKCSIFP